MLFNDLSLIEPLLRALEAEGYERPTPIQEQAIPPVLEGRDLLGCAQTGTGKTAAFALPMLQLLHTQFANVPTGGANRRPIRALILTPTRELAIQISESFTAYGKNLQIRNTVVFGGVGQTPQTDALRRGTDILIATPGRLLDLMNQGFVDFRSLSIFVFDEADRMLDMGFIHDVRKVIAKIPTKRQTLFFSATMPREIADLADSILSNPVKVAVDPPATTAEMVEQKVFFVNKHDKKNLLIHLLEDPDIKSALIFTRTKHGANRVAGDLTKAGIRAEAIHGNKSQTARVAALTNFKNGRNRALVATDIAARGIDIDALSHVINFELPNIPESYVHRIGRTGRAGASGIAFSFCEGEELPYLKDIQKLIGQQIPVDTEHPYVAELTAPPLPQPRSQQKPQRGRDNGRGRGTGRGEARPARSESQRPQPAGDVIPLPDSRPPRDPRPPRKEVNDQPRERNNDQQRERSAAPPRERNGDQPRERSNGNSRDRDRRDAPRDDRRPQFGSDRPDSRPRREEGPRPEQRRPQNSPAAGEKPSKQDIANEMRRRFSSILEVSSIEKQDFKRKPRPRFDERPVEPKTDKPGNTRGGNGGGRNSGGRGRGR
ncbi:MAG: DEAD/DEAH box helicase [Phycisphaerae bacterium]|nr:DEAD/DEAH box helicase [Saprospiraceae bacterium]